MALAGSSSGALTLTAPNATAVAEKEINNTPRSLRIFLFLYLAQAGLLRGIHDIRPSR